MCFITRTPTSWYSAGSEIYVSAFSILFCINYFSSPLWHGYSTGTPCFHQGSSSSLHSGTAPFCLFCFALLSNSTVWNYSDLRTFGNTLLHLRKGREQIRFSTFQRNFITVNIKRRAEKWNAFLCIFLLLPAFSLSIFERRSTVPLHVFTLLNASVTEKKFLLIFWHFYASRNSFLFIYESCFISLKQGPFGQNNASS